MRYASIDIETTGLAPEHCDILEIGAVIDDTEAPDVPVEQLPKFQTIVLPPRTEGVKGCYLGEPIALAMNAGILEKVSNFTKLLEPDRIEAVREGRFMYPDEVTHRLGTFFHNNNITQVWPAGKNFASFDRRFLEKLPGWNIKFGHRTLDPMTYWLRPNDKKPPNLQECCDRAGLGKVVTHCAVEDCYLVIQLIRAGMRRQPLDHGGTQDKTNPDIEVTPIFPTDQCPKCGSTQMEVKREGITGTLGRVVCVKCGTDIREWNAY